VPDFEPETVAALRDVVAFVTAAFVAAPSDVADVSPLLQRRVLSTLDEVVHRHGGQVVALSLLWLYWSTEAVARRSASSRRRSGLSCRRRIEARSGCDRVWWRTEDDP
jgi:hypothetical protein